MVRKGGFEPPHSCECPEPRMEQRRHRGEYRFRCNPPALPLYSRAFEQHQARTAHAFGRPSAQPPGRSMSIRPLFGVARRRPVLTTAWVAVCLLLVVQNVRLGRFMFDPSADWWLTTRNDLWAKHACLPAYIEAADLHRQGVTNIYDARYYAVLDRAAKPPLTVAHLAEWAGDPFQYPPPFLVLPHAALTLTNDYLTIRVCWYAVQLLAFVVICVLLAVWVGGPAGTAAALLIPGLWLSVPVMQNLQYGQFHLASLLLAIAGMLAFERHRHAAGGALLAAAALSKIFPGVLLLLLIVQRRWRAVAWTVMFAAAFTLGAFLVLGPHPFQAFFGYQLPRLLSGEAFDFTKDWPELRLALLADNLSPSAVVGKLRELGLTWMTPAVGTMALRVYTLVLVALTVAAGTRKTAAGKAGRVVIWLALLNLAALRAGGAWGDYITLGSAWLLTYLTGEAWRSRTKIVFLAVAWVTCLLVPGVQPVPVFLPPPLAMVLTSGIFAVVVTLNTWVLFRPDGLPTAGRSMSKGAVYQRVSS